jgi:hypothetical protein
LKTTISTRRLPQPDLFTGPFRRLPDPRPQPFPSAPALRALGARSHPGVDFSAAELMISALPNALANRCQRSIATATSRHHQRNSASSSAPLGAASRNSSCGSGRRMRSSAWKPSCDAPGAPAHESSTRSGAPFSSGSRRRQTRGETRSPHEARGIWPRRAMTRERRTKGARDVRGRGGGLSPLGHQPTNMPPARAFFSTYDLGQVSALTSFS